MMLLAADHQENRVIGLSDVDLPRAATKMRSPIHFLMPGGCSLPGQMRKMGRTE
jgi:hypothetical protein